MLVGLYMLLAKNFVLSLMRLALYAYKYAIGQSHQRLPTAISPTYMNTRPRCSLMRGCRSYGHQVSITVRLRLFKQSSDPGSEYFERLFFAVSFFCCLVWTIYVVGEELCSTADAISLCACKHTRVTYLLKAKISLTLYH